MGENIYIFTQNCRLRQQVTLVLTGLIMFIASLTLLFDRGIWAWTSLMVVSAGMIAVNFLLATLYNVRKDEVRVLIENLWRKRSYPIEALVEVRSLKFVLPFPLNPYVKFIFSDGRSFIGTIPHPLIVSLRRGGIRQYLENVREQWRA
jgi:hypothetical protein